MFESFTIAEKQINSFLQNTQCRAVVKTSIYDRRFHIVSAFDPQALLLFLTPTEQHLWQVEKLKAKLTKFPVLNIYSPTNGTELHCDVSKMGYGAVLIERESDNLFYPIFCFSTRTSEVKARYHSFKLETLAVIYALRRFRIYLQGIPFKIVTDRNAWKLTLDKQDVNRRISGWSLELETFDKTFDHRSGDKMKYANAFNRSANVLIIQDNTFESNLIICQNHDPKIRELREKLGKTEDRLFEMRNGLIIDNGITRFYFTFRKKWKFTYWGNIMIIIHFKQLLVF